MNETPVTAATREILVRGICRKGDIRLPGYRFLIGRTHYWRAIVLADGPVTGEDLRAMDAEVKAAGLLHPFNLWTNECRYGDTITWQVHRIPPSVRSAAIRAMP